MEFFDGLIVHLYYRVECYLLVIHAKHSRAVGAEFQHSPLQRHICWIFNTPVV